MANNFEIKKKIVESGNSKIFNNWHEFTGVSMEDFLEGLEWVCGDEFDDQNRVTRQLVCTIDGQIKKCNVVRGKDGFSAYFYDESGALASSRSSNICARDKV